MDTTHYHAPTSLTQNDSIVMNASSLVTAGDVALLQSIMGSTMFNIVLGLIALGIAIIPLLSYLAALREEKRRIREVAALERQAEALYTISTQYVIVKRK